MNDDWFRNEDWNADIARRFEQKLGRARQKGQYLRIQAFTLAPTHPLVALELLDRYFALGERVFDAVAHVDRATALMTLGKFDAAADAYEAALAREREFPSMKTQASLELPMLIASHELRVRFPRAKSLLAEHREGLSFPLQNFQRHAARALIASAEGDHALARQEAKSALDAASLKHSGLRSHPTLGLVLKDSTKLLDRLASMASA